MENPSNPAYVLRYEDRYLFSDIGESRSNRVPGIGDRGPLVRYIPATNQFWVQFRMEHWNGTPEQRHEGRIGAVEERVRYMASQGQWASILAGSRHLLTFVTRGAAEAMRVRVWRPDLHTVEEVDLHAIPEFYTGRDQSYFTISDYRTV